jgi:hypothetical protein
MRVRPDHRPQLTQSAGWWSWRSTDFRSSCDPCLGPQRGANAFPGMAYPEAVNPEGTVQGTAILEML